MNGRTVLVQGAAGSVGLCAVQLARFAGARVIGTVRSPSDEATAKSAGAHEVLVGDKELSLRVRALAPRRYRSHRRSSVGANIEADVELLKQDGSIASYATGIQEHSCVLLRKRRFPEGSEIASRARFECCAGGGLARLRDR